MARRLQSKGDLRFLLLYPRKLSGFHGRDRHGKPLPYTSTTSSKVKMAKHTAPNSVVVYRMSDMTMPAKKKTKNASVLASLKTQARGNPENKDLYATYYGKHNRS